jgi:hypothetical protein
MNIHILFARTGERSGALRVFTRVRLAGVGVITLLGVISSPAQGAGLPVVISATVDYTQKTLTFTGQNFGGAPSVTLDSMAFRTMNSSSSQVVADLPTGTPPTSLTPGTYFRR